MADADTCARCGGQLVEDEEITCEPCLWELKYESNRMVRAAHAATHPSPCIPNTTGDGNG